MKYYSLMILTLKGEELDALVEDLRQRLEAKQAEAEQLLESKEQLGQFIVAAMVNLNTIICCIMSHVFCSGSVVQALESKVGEYRQRLRVIEVAQEQMEAGWEEARRAREAEWQERLVAAEEARAALQSRWESMKGWQRLMVLITN